MTTLFGYHKRAARRAIKAAGHVLGPWQTRQSTRGRGYAVASVTCAQCGSSFMVWNYGDGRIAGHDEGERCPGDER